MKRVTTILVILITLALVRPIISPFFGMGETAVAKLGQIPVLESGRVKPLDSVARATLLIFRGKQSIKTEEGKVTAMEWMANVLLNREEAEKMPVFRVDHPHLVSLLGSEPGTKKYFSYNELKPWLSKVQEQARLVDENASNRNPYERAVLQLFSNLIQYQQLTQTIYPAMLPGTVETFYRENLNRTGKVSSSSMNRQLLMGLISDMAQSPVHFLHDGENWSNAGSLLRKASISDKEMKEMIALARLADAKKSGEESQFDLAVTEYLEVRSGPDISETGMESYYNSAQLFVVSMEIYVLVMLIVLIAWQFSLTWLLKSAMILVCIGLSIHTIGLVLRVLITGYAPVTNLYSSAVFVGWVAVLLSILFEKFQKKGIGSIGAASVGFLTLLVAHHLADNGDTMEKMRAVLNSNFWLSTHVITITMGYGATFLGGFLGIIYIFYGWLNRSIDESLQKSFHRMLYATVAFSLLFSFIGTVLGGIWADQSWGRFWGWDPKENGALMIVLWTSLILHALRGGMIKTRGLVHLCIVGNVITAWSWFGTNMLGVGLHAYGFMDSAFFWLVMFWLSQFLFMGLEWLFPVRLRRA